MSKKRSILLSEGRKRGGTHFIWLDADEIFSEDFMHRAKELIGQLKSGEKISMRWVQLWKSVEEYRDDSSVFGKIYKDFIICDSPELSYEKKFISENRTPGENRHLRQLDDSLGVVLHFQFAVWERTQWKQAWYRCIELIDGTRSARKINNTYSITLDTNDAILKTVPEKWISNIVMPDISTLQYPWYKETIIYWFEKYGIEFFEPLQIWHITELRTMFVEKMGREPRVKVYPKVIIMLNKIRLSIKNILRK
jgi:hypothetical protein